MKQQGLKDAFGRVMHDLRISVTDRCNFRCLYCLPETEEASEFYRQQKADPSKPSAKKPICYSWKPKSEILSFEEITRFVRIAARMGVHKIRITGGEPLLRRGVAQLVSAIRAIPGIKDVALTSNGFLFSRYAQALKDAGLSRMTFSLDSLDPANFQKMTGRTGLQSVLESIALAKRMDFDPVKVNAVIIRGLNDHELEALVRFGRDAGVRMRFIEYMPLDSGKAWQREMVVAGSEMLERIRQQFALVPLEQAHAAETAKRWKHADGRGEIGIIASVTMPFCQQCNRLRLTSDGHLRTCLFTHQEHDFKTMLRGQVADEVIMEKLQSVVWNKESGHNIGHQDFRQPQRTMSSIGG
jgi:GTP 3',8-cyclase